MSIIGVPKEVKDHEYRVAVTAAGADMLAREGHRVLIQLGAGEGSGIRDEEYMRAGAEIVTREKVFAEADIIAKVKEPQPSEFDLMNEGQTLFTYLHLAASRDLTEALLRRRVNAIGLETVQADDGGLPLLAPMSEVAGRVAVSAAAKYLERPMGGKGKLLSGVPGVRSGVVVILGAGIVGSAAARLAAGLGAEVFILDTNLARLKAIFDTYPPNVHPLASSPYAIRQILPMADAVIGAVLIPGGRTPTLVTEKMLKLMEPGSVIIDVAVDQGGCVETARPTTHSNPVYLHEGILHYCVTNMPGAVAHTSTHALTNATLPYLMELADKGWRGAIRDNAALRRGVNVSAGEINHPAVAETFGMQAEPARA